MCTFRKLPSRGPKGARKLEEAEAVAVEAEAPVREDPRAAVVPEAQRAAGVDWPIGSASWPNIFTILTPLEVSAMFIISNSRRLNHLTLGTTDYPVT